MTMIQDIHAIAVFLWQYPKTAIGLVLIILVFGVLGGLFIKSLLVWLLCKVGGFHFIGRIPKKWLNYGASWAHYRRHNDAVILGSLNECKSFLQYHFADCESGEVWLFRTDLRAFWDPVPFRNLYHGVIDAIENIEMVRILVPKGDFDKTDSKGIRVISKRHWANIYEHLVALKHTKKIVWAEYDEFDSGETDFTDAFKKYISDESFIFYTSGRRLQSEEAICVHRRYDSGGDGHDLRITLVASRGGDKSRSDPLYQRFLRHPHYESFQNIFCDSRRIWQPLIDAASSRR